MAFFVFLGHVTTGHASGPTGVVSGGTIVPNITIGGQPIIVGTAITTVTLSSGGTAPVTITGSSSVLVNGQPIVTTDSLAADGGKPLAVPQHSPTISIK